MLCPKRLDENTHLLYVTGHGILGLMEVLVEIWVFTFFESLICLKYTGKILDMLSTISQSYERFNDVAFYEFFGRIYCTCSHKYFNAQEYTVYLCNKLLSVESFCVIFEELYMHNTFISLIT